MAAHLLWAWEVGWCCAWGQSVTWGRRLKRLLSWRHWGCLLSVLAGCRACCMAQRPRSPVRSRQAGPGVGQWKGRALEEQVAAEGTRRLRSVGSGAGMSSWGHPRRCPCGQQAGPAGWGSVPGGWGPWAQTAASPAPAASGCWRWRRPRTPRRMPASPGLCSGLSSVWCGGSGTRPSPWGKEGRGVRQAKGADGRSKGEEGYEGVGVWGVGEQGWSERGKKSIQIAIKVFPQPACFG